MKLSAVIIARAIAFFETVNLAPRGGVFFPHVIAELVKQYSFQKYPQSFEAMDETKGIDFLMGKSGENVIEKLTIYNAGILVETRAGTDVSQRIVLEMMEWAKTKFGIEFQESMVTRWAYVSMLTFQSSASLLNLHPAVEELCRNIDGEIRKFGEAPKYQSVVFTVGHDPLDIKNSFAPFSIQRRAGEAFDAGKYYSEAPLPTKAHIELLEKFERGVSGK